MLFFRQYMYQINPIPKIRIGFYDQRSSISTIARMWLQLYC